MFRWPLSPLIAFVDVAEKTSVQYRNMMQCETPREYRYDGFRTQTFGPGLKRRVLTT